MLNISKAWRAVTPMCLVLAGLMALSFATPIEAKHCA